MKLSTSNTVRDNTISGSLIAMTILSIVVAPFILMASPKSAASNSCDGKGSGDSAMVVASFESVLMDPANPGKQMISGVVEAGQNLILLEEFKSSKSDKVLIAQRADGLVVEAYRNNLVCN